MSRFNNGIKIDITRTIGVQANWPIDIDITAPICSGGNDSNLTFDFCPGVEFFVAATIQIKTSDTDNSRIDVKSTPNVDVAAPILGWLNSLRGNKI